MENLLTQEGLIQDLTEQLESLLKSVSWFKNWKVERNPAPFERVYDIIALIDLPDGNKIEMWVEVHKEPRPAHFPYERVNQVFPYVNLTSQFNKDGTRKTHVPVFAAPYISPRMAEICENHHWSWFDLSGNCFFSVPELLHIERRGAKPAYKRARPIANLSTPATARVIRALLSPNNMGMEWTQTSLREHIGGLRLPSIGLVNKVVRFLREEAFIKTLDDRKFQLKDPSGLLTAWRDAYRFDRNKRRGYFTLSRGQFLSDALTSLESITGGHAAYAVFSAADFQAPHVRQNKIWLYLSERFERDFIEIVGAQPVESGENLVVLFPPDDGVFYMQEGYESNRLACTTEAQTYVDLWYCGGRGKEAAEVLLETRIKPIWKTLF